MSCAELHNRALCDLEQLDLHCLDDWRIGSAETYNDAPLGTSCWVSQQPAASSTSEAASGGGKVTNAQQARPESSTSGQSMAQFKAEAGNRDFPSGPTALPNIHQLAAELGLRFDANQPLPSAFANLPPGTSGCWPSLGCLASGPGPRLPPTPPQQPGTPHQGSHPLLHPFHCPPRGPHSLPGSMSQLELMGRCSGEHLGQSRGPPQAPSCGPSHLAPHLAPGSPCLASPGSGTGGLVSAGSGCLLTPRVTATGQLVRYPSLGVLASSAGGVASPEGSRAGDARPRHDRLNQLIELLAEMVPPAQGVEQELGGKAMGEARGKRPRHAVLADTIQLLQRLGCTAHQPPLAMPLAMDISPSATGVMVEQGSRAGEPWMMRVTCRDRPGLLADISAALRALPLSITAASVVTTAGGKAQQVYRLQVHDTSLTPDELQCAVNAALYAHLLDAATLAAAPALVSGSNSPVSSPNALGSAAAALAPFSPNQPGWTPCAPCLSNPQLMLPQGTAFEQLAQLGSPTLSKRARRLSGGLWVVDLSVARL
ncbi:hypothetical protein QJQ45_021419, partial [Haematococcus lacustris]